MTSTTDSGSENTFDNPLVVVVMGVSGCGKSSIAERLAHELNAHFKDGDELHPKANIDKMSAGIPLDDDDRQPWLELVARYAAEHARKSGICVIACSALKRHYRQTLRSAGNVVFVYLHGSRELIASRMHQRSGHFMPETLLDSQFTALEDPRQDAQLVVTVSIEPDIATIAGNAHKALREAGYLDTRP